MFRFPLRQENHESELGVSAYPAEKIEKMFRSLQQEGHLNLLFLRHIESIELYRKADEKSDPELLCSIHTSTSCLETVRKKRGELLEKMKAHANCSLTYELKLEVWDNETEITHEFFVCQHCSRPRSNDLEQHLPLVGTALPLCETDEPLGQIFCFLPLPTEERSPTGLGTHVNGYFGVEQNRRHIKWPKGRQTDSTDDTLRWNMHLLKELLPKGLIVLAEFAANRLKEDRISLQQVRQTIWYHIL